MTPLVPRASDTSAWPDLSDRQRLRTLRDLLSRMGVRAAAARLGVSHEAIYAYLRARPRAARALLGRSRASCPRCGAALPRLLPRAPAG